MAYPASRTVANATAYIGRSFPYRRCLVFTRQMMGIPGVAPTASAAWYSAKGKHPGDRNPPAGAPVFWSGGSGHVAVSLGGGVIVTTDYPNKGRVGKTTIDTLTRAWHKNYLGWTETLNGQRVGLGSTSAPANAQGAAYIPVPIPGGGKVPIPLPGLPGPMLPGSGNPGGDVLGGVKDTAQAFQALGQFLAFLANPKMWIRVAMFLAGLAALVVGISIVISNQSTVRDTVRAGVRTATAKVARNAS